MHGARTLARPDEWAIGMGLKVDGKPFDLTGREYIRQVIRDYSPEIWIPKAAQMAFTITALTRTTHNLVERRWNGLYLLPIKDGARTFVQARFDPIIESNDFLNAEFSSVDNRLHKQTTNKANLYFRGTNIRRELQEIPVDFQVWDERDRMVDENLPEARHRMDASQIQQLFVISTPTEPGHGVDAEDAWSNTDQHRWEVKCPSCSRYQVLNFEERDLDYSNVKLGDTASECVCLCAFCKHEWTDWERWAANATGRWVPYNPEGRLRGYHISQLNSATQRLETIMEDYYKGQIDAQVLKSFYNQNMGRPYVAAGDMLTVEMLDKVRVRGHTLGGIPDGPAFIGIDIGGTFIHLLAYTKTTHNSYRLWQAKLFREFHEVDEFLSGLSSFVAVCDAHPEKREARNLALKYHGQIYLGFHDERQQANEIAVFNKLERGVAPKVLIDKTMAMDQVISDFMNGLVIWPANAREIGESVEGYDYNGLYYQHLQLVRVQEETTRGLTVSKWKKNRKADHWHHTQMFARIAMMQKPRLSVPVPVGAAFRRAGSFVRG